MSLEADLNDVAVFAKVIECHSFTAAGRALSMPRSTVSRRVAQLERRLGVRLLQRTTRRLQLTDIGASYYEACTRALATLDEAEAVVKEAQLKPRGVLRMTAPHDLQDVLAPLVASFVCKHRDVQIAVELSQRMVDLVGEGFDIALRASAMMPDSSLIARRIGSATGYLYASPRYLERTGTPKSPSELVNHSCIVLGPRRPHASWALTDSDSDAEATLSATIWVNDPSFARLCAEAHAGIAFLPMIGDPGPHLVRVLPKWRMRHEGALYVVYPSAAHLSASVRAFRDHLIAGMATLFSSASPTSA
jgi:DNA-binding transcriptional LysR family regulator